MANSISLSTDMKKIYLLFPDSTSPQEFSLTGNGVNITSTSGNVQVAVASSALTQGSDDFSIVSVAQWGAVFHENTDQLMMIGNEDIESQITASVDKFPLSGGGTYNLRLDSAQTKLLIRTGK